jgi:small Trp-rich protein
MPLVAVGTLLLILKLLEIDPVAGWSWWWILSPFGAATVWWVWADATGWTQRRAMDRMEKRKVSRRERDMAALGLNVQSDRRSRATRNVVKEARERSKERQTGGDGPKA